LSNVPFSALVWLLPLAIALHELEEWNILGWYQRHLSDLPRKTEASTRAFLIFVSLLGLLWTAAATLAPPAVTAFLLSPLVAVVLLNALQHVYWWIAFQAYAPGVITSVVLLIPVPVLLGGVALAQGLLPAWYVALLLVLVALGLVQTIRAGNRLTPGFRAISRFGRFLARLLGIEGE
jgi:hypothetical protein